MNAFARFMSMVMDQKEDKDLREGSKGMHYITFLQRLEQEVHEFRSYWECQHIKQPDVFPLTLPSDEEWIEQFICWLGTR